MGTSDLRKKTGAGVKWYLRFLKNDPAPEEERLRNVLTFIKLDQKGEISGDQLTKNESKPREKMPRQLKNQGISQEIQQCFLKQIQSKGALTRSKDRLVFLFSTKYTI